jgi:hypothetical protein
VAASTSGCEVTFDYEFPGGLSSSATVERIEPNGTFTGAVGLRADTGSFNNAQRTGSFGVGVTDTIAFGTDSYLCVDDDDCDGQVLPACGSRDDGSGVCE